MVKNIKFHATAIALIILVIIVLSMLIGPASAPKADPNAPLKPTDHYVRIASATWGIGCTPYIEDAIRLQASTPLAKDDKGNAIPQKLITHVVPDNVLPAVKAICDGKVTCEIPVNSQALGFEPLEACYKKLSVGYRCFDLDRITTKEIDQGQNLPLDCRPAAPNDSAPAAAHP